MVLFTVGIGVGFFIGLVFGVRTCTSLEKKYWAMLYEKGMGEDEVQSS